jgi:hypothetical protein
MENMIFKGQKLTTGLDLGDHWSCYCGSRRNYLFA